MHGVTKKKITMTNGKKRRLSDKFYSDTLSLDIERTKVRVVETKDFRQKKISKHQFEIFKNWIKIKYFTAD